MAENDFVVMPESTVALEGQDSYQQAYAEAYAQVSKNLHETRDVIFIMMWLFGGPLGAVYLITSAYQRLSKLPWSVFRSSPRND